MSFLEPLSGFIYYICRLYIYSFAQAFQWRSIPFRVKTKVYHDLKVLTDLHPQPSCPKHWPLYHLRLTLTTSLHCHFSDKQSIFQWIGLCICCFPDLGHPSHRTLWPSPVLISVLCSNYALISITFLTFTPYSSSPSQHLYPLDILHICLFNYLSCILSLMTTEVLIFLLLLLLYCSLLDPQAKNYAWHIGGT